MRSVFVNFYLDVWKNYFNFSDRATRQQYWMFALFNLIIVLILGVIDGVLGLGADAGIGLLGGIYSLAILIPSIAVTVRRLHDMGRSGWWLLLWLIPLIGVIVIFIFTLLDSQPATNEWGPSLKYGEGSVLTNA